VEPGRDKHIPGKLIVPLGLKTLLGTRLGADLPVCLSLLGVEDMGKVLATLDT
jgi:hypothetical protein